MDKKSKKTHVFQASNALDASEWVSAMKQAVGGGRMEKSATAPPTIMREDSVQTLDSGESAKSEPVAVMSREVEKDEVEKAIAADSVARDTMASVVEKEKRVSKFGSMFRRKSKKVVEVEEGV